MDIQIQKIKLLNLILVIIVCSSCQFNQSVNKDFITGASSRGDGIGCDDVRIEINGETVTRTEFVYGEKVEFIFNDIRGLTPLDGKTYPEFSIYIVKNEKDTVLSNPNLLRNLKGGTDLSPLQLIGNIRAYLPYQNKEKYSAHVNIWDRKGDGKFSYKLPFTIKDNGLFNIQNNGIEFSRIYLRNKTLKQDVVDKNVSFEDVYHLVLDDIGGLELKNNKVFPIFSLDLIDNNGNKILSNPNILNVSEKDGINPQDLKTHLSAKINFTKGKTNNPYQLIVNLKDKNSSKEINITTELILN